MKKINRHVLSLPPHLSTSWKNISSLHIKGELHAAVLVVTLRNNSQIEIPDLDQQTLQHIFATHTQCVEAESSPAKESPSTQPKKNALSFSMGLPFALPNGEGMEQFTSMLQHNPDQAQLPDLPQEVIEKIQAITQAMGFDPKHINAPKAEPHCNCMYCQIARAVYAESPSEPEEEKEEEVSLEELQFRNWDIKHEGDKRYLVTNPLDQNEHYQVYLGTPVGCTCGQNNCEHIRVVLSS